MPFGDPTKAEIWAMVRAMNDTWTMGDPDALPDALADYFHADMVAVTPVARHRLDGGATCAEGWKSFAKAAKVRHWKELDPVIHVYGDAAVVAYDFDMSFEMGGGMVKSAGRDLLFAVKQNGRWRVVADQFSPYPS
jgi:ketosteroid isomerase-like protein